MQRADALADHLEACPRCEATVQTLERQGDTLLAKLRLPVQARSLPGRTRMSPGRRAFDRWDNSDRISRLPSRRHPHRTPWPVRAVSGNTTCLRSWARVAWAPSTRPGIGNSASWLPLGFSLPPWPKTRNRIAPFQAGNAGRGTTRRSAHRSRHGCRRGRPSPLLGHGTRRGARSVQILDHVGPLAVADACEIARQTAAGLRAADERGLVHRDIKPSNLMLAADGQVRDPRSGIGSL